MVYFDTSAEWFSQSSLLLKARPTSTKITSKYTVLKPSASKIQKHQKWLAKKASKTPTSTSNPNPDTDTAMTSDTEPALPPKATFELKTYDPASGVCLKYQTNKAAEVGRLVGNLGKLGRHMAALPEVVEDFGEPAKEAVETPGLESQGKGILGGEKVGGKKKKKGKK